MADKFDYDLFVVGAGSGGVRAARMAASAGVRVGIAENRDLGGTCVNVGCVPKKLFVYASKFSETFHIGNSFGWSSEAATFDWPTLRDNKNTEIARLNAIYAHLLDSSGADLFSERAVLSDANTIAVGGRNYTARYILLAVGGWPHIPEFPGSQYALSSNEMFSLERLPATAVVVGGGYIALEFAGILNGLGVSTHLIYRGQRLLKSFDSEMIDKVEQGMRAKGVKIHLNTTVERIERVNESHEVFLSDKGRLSADLVLYATGRQANTDNLGLDNTSVKTRRNGSIIVDKNFKTHEPSIFALGDVIDRVQLTPVAIQEAMVLVDYLFGRAEQTVAYHNIPTAVFSQPEFASVGMTEEQAKVSSKGVSVFVSDFRPMFQSLSGGDDRITMKLVVELASDLVLGCHMVGEHAAEIIQGMAIAMSAGATKKQFDSTIGIHPSAAEEFVTMRTSAR
ncbi:MAG: glutathione-disulfide reductase [Cellvibrionales bacterium TMED148]|nr:glutathione-disulfide reductase [Porticoccaceae bacterium]RPG90772.1 MAG: glutathione-disulfide reductase [Cellvibrionales bacterium TMED148]